MKKLLLSFGMMIAVLALHSQTVIFQDNFDSYTAGAFLCVQNNTDWTTWSNDPGSDEDALISNAQSYSTANSLNIMGDNDIIYRFANQTNGKYRVEMRYFIPTGSLGGYFNLQHYFVPGTQWAFEVYFNGTGSGQLKAGGTDYNFTVPVNNWFHIQADINLDDDLCTLFIEGTEISTWPFHYQAGNQNGINQLGSVDLYGGYLGGTGGGGNYFVDNFIVSELSAADPGDILIAPDDPIVMIVPISGGNTSINISNPGGAAIDYEIIPVYNIPDPNPTSTGATTITYAGVASGSGIGFTNGTQYTVAVGYSPSMLQNHIGKTVKQYRIYINSNASAFISGKLCIWKMGSMGYPSLDPPVYEQTINSLNDGDNFITLTTPFLIDGSYLYIGLDLIVTPGDTYTFLAVGTDVTPENQCNKLGRLYRSAVAWTAISGLAGYWDMGISVDGTPIKPWMTLDHTTNTLQPGANKDLNITFGASDIVDNCIKDGKLYIHSTVFEKEETVIDVNINFGGSAPILAITPTSIDEAALEGTITVPVTISNTGEGDGSYEAKVVSDEAWLTIEGDTQGTVASNGEKTFNALLNFDELEEDIEYDAVIQIITNDPVLKTLDIPCKAKIGVGIDDYKMNIVLFPNPATDLVNIVCSKMMNNIQLINYMGQIVYSEQVNAEKTTINTSNLSAGIYFVKIISEGTTNSMKLIVK